MPFAPRPAQLGWRPETTAIVVGAAVASLLASLVWAGVLWRYLSPKTFQSGLLLGGPLSPDFIAFVLRAVFHASVLAGAIVAFARRPSTGHRLLLAGALGVVAIGLYHFVRVNLFPYSANARRGLDVLFNAVDTGVRFIHMGIPHMLLALAMSRPVRGRPPPSGGAPVPVAPVDVEEGRPDPAQPLPYSAHGEDKPLEARAVVLAAGVAALGSLAHLGMLVGVAALPPAFRTIGVTWSDFKWITPVYALADAALVVGAAAALLGRKWARPVLLNGAWLRLALFAYGFVHSWTNPPGGMPRYKGPELAVSLTTDVARIVTTATVYALLIYVLRRGRGDATARPGVLSG